MEVKILKQTTVMDWKLIAVLFMIKLSMVSFKEYYDFVGGDKREAYEEYALYVGMPLVISKKTDD